MKKKFDVIGMTCSACSAHVEKAVGKVDGVKKVAVNLLANSMIVTYDDNKTNDGLIIKAVESAGYSAAVSDNLKQPSAAYSFCRYLCCIDVRVYGAYD